MRGPLASLSLIVALLSGNLSAEPLQITGKVLLPADATDVRIELLPQELRFETTPPLATAVPRRDGSYDLQAPGPGFYRVRIEAKGFLPLEHFLPALFEDVELASAAPPRASGFRTRVFDPAGLSPAGVRVLIISNSSMPQDQDDSRWNYALRETVTDETGKALLPHRKGETLIFIAARPQAVAFAGPFEVDRLEAIRFGRLTTLEIRGLDGKPAAGALVRLGSIPLTMTGEDGRLNVSIAKEGAAFLVEAANGAGAEVLLTPDSPSSVKIALQKRRRITGRVVDAATRQPLEGALVQADEAFTRTGADGSFRLEVIPQSRDLYLSAVAEGHLAGMAKAAEEPILFALERSADLTGAVVDSAGRPIAGAQVRVFSVQIRYSMDDPTDGMARTSTEGKFRIRGLRAGQTYAVAVDGRGFAPARLFADLSGSAPLRIVVVPGAVATGQVVDEGGLPVSGVSVSLHPLAGSGLMARWPDRAKDRPLGTTADAEGRFRFPHLRAGRFDLHAKREGFGPTLVSGVEIPEGNRELDLGEVRLSAGAAIEGRVFDEQGRPVADALVTLSLTTPTTLPRRAVEMELPKPVLSEPDGSFRFQDLPAGSRLDLWVHSDGYLGKHAPGVLVPTSEPLRIELRRGRTLAGRVVGPDGKPVPRAKIGHVTKIRTSVGRGSTGTSGAGTRAETDEEGRFRLIELEPGTFNLLVQAEGLLTKIVEGIQIPDDGEPQPVEVVLEEGGALEGRVLDGNAKPLAGVQVSVSPRTIDESAYPLDGAQAVSDAGGRYRLAGLAAGPYYVMADSADLERRISKNAEILSGVHYLDLQFPSGVEVSGVVTDSNGRPIPLAEVSLTPSRTGYIPIARTSADGTFVFPSVPDGDFFLGGHSPGFSDKITTNQVRIAGQPVSGLVLQLEAGAVITGRLLGVSAEELPRIRIYAASQSPRIRPLFGQVDPPGTYRITDASPGTWRVQASIDNDRSTFGTVEVTASGETVVLDLEFAKGFTLSGRVTVDGEPFARATVALAGTQQRTASTAHDGSFTIPDLPWGTYTLAVVLESGAGYAQKLEVTADQEIAVSISTGRIEGRVLSPEGLPVPGVVVTLTGEDAYLKATFQGPSVRTDELGIFRLGRLPAGTYHATIQAEDFAPAETRSLVPPGGTVHVEIALERQ